MEINVGRVIVSVINLIVIGWLIFAVITFIKRLKRIR